MRILWLTNIMLPEFAEAVETKIPSVGGWLSGALNAIKAADDIDLSVCFPYGSSDSGVIKKNVNGTDYYGFPRSKKPIHVYDPSTEKNLNIILDQVKPDIVHIWGTEFAHSLAMTRAFSNPDKTIISIQGLCSEIAKQYLLGVPSRVAKTYTLKDLLKRDSLNCQMKKFAARGKNETEALKSVGHVIGRTGWDRKAAEKIAPDAEYHFCNETLREAFYKNSGAWNYDACEKHSIFVSQASYPIKGFHQMLKAMPKILKRYPDTKLYTTGRDPRKQSFIKADSYSRWLSDLMKKNGLDDKVEFLGNLSEEQMCSRFLKSNVFVSASSLENSPNSVGEAMLLGVPTVASRVGGTSDMLTDKDEGLLYPSDDCELLADCVCKMFDSPDEAYLMGRRAVEHAMVTHDPENNLKILIDIYKKVAE